MRIRNSKFRLALLTMLVLAAFAAYLFATSTDYTQAFAASHGWTYTQLSCSGGATCTSGDVADGNPTPGVYAKVAGKNKAMTGYWSKAYTWANLGVTAGDTVSTVNGQWDDLAIQTVAACLATTVIGMQIYDSGNTIQATAAAVEADLNVAGDTAAWTNHNPTGAVAVSAAYQASSTTVTLRFNVSPASANSTGAACELRGDNYKLTIVHTTPSGRKAQTITAELRGR
jgi:hypothetical protein